MNRPEETIQRQIAGYLSWALAEPAYWTAIGHGSRGEMQGIIYKQMGVRAGFPDVALFLDGRAYFLEIKSARGQLSDAQKRTHEALRAAGCLVAVIRSLDELRALLAGPWWPLGACLRETKLSTERVRRGFTDMTPHALILEHDWPASDDLSRRRGKAP